MSATANWRRALGAIGYLAAFAFLTFPLLRSPATRVAADFSPDLEHSLWIQWWFDTALTSGERSLFRSAEIAFPHVVDLQLADLNLAANALAFLVGRALGPAATHNLLLLLAFLLAGALTWRLALKLGASAAAGWSAGLFFAASPVWVASELNGWWYLIHTWTLPLVLLAALAARGAPGLRSGSGLGLALSLAFHVTPYYFLYALLLLALLAALRAPALRAWLRGRAAWLALAVAGLWVLLLVGPRAAAMAHAASQGLVVHHGPLNTELALPLLELFWPSAQAVQSRLPELGYLMGFAGFTLLASLGLASAWAGRAACARGRPWLAVAGVALLLALGPRLVLAHGLVTGVPLPAALLQRLPGFDATTNHWRWSVVASLGLAIALAHALSGVERRLADRRPVAARLLAPLLTALLACEIAWLWPLPFPRPLWEVQASPVASALRARDDVHAVLDRTPRRKLNQTVHGKPIALGWLPRVDRATQQANEALVADCRGRDPGCLRRHGIDAVIRDDHNALLLDETGATRELLRSEAGAGEAPTQ